MIPPNRRRRPQPKPDFIPTAPTEEAREAEALEHKMKTPIAELQLSVRVVNALEDHDVIFVEDLMKLDYDTLLTMKNFGEATFREAKSAIRKLGLKAPNWRKPPKPKRGRKKMPPKDPNVGSMLSLW